MDTKYEAESEGKAIQGLSYMGIHLTCSHKTQALWGQQLLKAEFHIAQSSLKFAILLS